MRGVLASLCILFVPALALPLQAADARVDSWVQSLTSSSKHSRLMAGYGLQLPHREDEEALVRSLLPLVTNGHEDVRAYVASFLGEHRALVLESIPALISLLGDPSLKVREHAAIALAQIGPPAVPLLLRELNAPNQPGAPPQSRMPAPPLFDRRDYAYAALYEIGPVALPKILSLFHSLDVSGEGYSAALLRTFASEKPGTFVARFFEAPVFERGEVYALLDQSVLPLVSPLLDKFDRSSPSQRRLAAFALATLYLEFEPALRGGSAEFPDPHVRSQADLFSRQYARLIDPSAATAFLTTAIVDSQNPWRIRESMTSALRDLFVAMKDPSNKESQRVIGSALAKVVTGEREPWPLRQAAAEALDHANLLESFSLSSLRGVLRDRSAPWPVKTACATIAGRKGVAATPAVPDLQSLVSSGDHNTLRLAAAQALGHLGEPGLDALASLLRGADEDTRILAVFGIAESGTLGDSLRREASTNASARVRLAERVARPEVSIPIRVAPRYVPQPASAKMEPTRISFVDFSGVSTQELAQNLAKPDRQGIVAAADELGRRGPEGIQVLRRHVAGPNRFASAAAIAALSRAGKDATPAVPELCNALLDENLQSGAAHALWIVGGYGSECEQMLTTVLKDGLIHDYVTTDLDARPQIALWRVPEAEPPPENPRDPLRIEDLLQPPRNIKVGSGQATFPSTSAREETSLPSLAMPTPSTWDTIPLTLSGDKSVYGAYTRILAALADYHTFGLFAAPGGFTLVTRVEQIDPNWKPLSDTYRWRSDRPSVSPLSLFSFFREMLFAPPGAFRMIAFMVTTNLRPEFSGEAWTEDEARKKFLEGAKILPESFRDIPYSGHYCHVLIYNYDKPLAKMARLQDGAAGVAEVESQLRSAGIWNKLR